MKKKIRRRIFSDTYPPHVETYRKFAYPSPPKKVRHLLWTAPIQYIFTVQSVFKSEGPAVIKGNDYKETKPFHQYFCSL